MLSIRIIARWARAPNAERARGVRAGQLRRVCARGGHARRHGARRRDAVGDRAGLLGREAGGGARRVRGPQYAGWYRYIMPALCAHAIRRRGPRSGSTEEKGDPQRPLRPSARGRALLPLVPMTVPEVRHLLVRLTLRRPPDPPSVLRWSVWRRYHQAHAQAAHHRHRLRRESEVQL